MPATSPFPGMDPWLERHWESIHFTYVQECRRQVAGQLPDGLFCEVEETVYVVDDGDPIGTVRPDAGVFEMDDPDGVEARSPTGAAVATPVRIALAAEPVVRVHVAIRSVRAGEPLVTAIEVFSPTNKRTMAARRQYRRNRRAYRGAGANVVEIDLLRRGRPLVDVPDDQLTDAQRTPYRAAVRRAAQADRPLEVEYYPLPLRDRLPRIAVPLRAADADVDLDLQQPIDEAYALGGYGRRIDYSVPPDPPLSADDAAWAAERAAAAAAG